MATNGSSTSYPVVRVSLGRLSRRLAVTGGIVGLSSVVALAAVSDQIDTNYAVLVLATDGLMAALLTIAGAVLTSQVRDCIDAHHQEICEQLEGTLRVEDFPTVARLGPVDKARQVSRRGD